LTPSSIAALAEAIAEALARRAIEQTEGGHLSQDEHRLLTAREVAAMLRRTAEWVRHHREELGVIRLGNGPRPRLLFHPQAVAERLDSRSESESSHEAQTPEQTGKEQGRPRRRSGTTTGLLPFPGSERLSGSAG
jgi:hypothetical protein